MPKLCPGNGTKAYLTPEGSKPTLKTHAGKFVLRYLKGSFVFPTYPFIKLQRAIFTLLCRLSKE